MAYIIRPERWKQPPDRPVEIDWAHPLAQGLRWYGLGNQLLRNSRYTLTGSATPSASSRGEGLQFPSGANYVNLNENLSAPTLEASGFFVSQPNNLAGYPELFSSCGAQTSYAGHTLYHGASGDVTAIYGDNTGAAASDYRYASSAAGSVIAGRVYKTGFICRAAADWTLVIDDALVTPTYGGTAPVYAAGTANATVNRQGNIYGEQTFVMGAYWWRALSEAELLAFSENPYQILVPRKRVVYYAATTGAGRSSSTSSATSIGAYLTVEERAAIAAGTATASGVIDHAESPVIWGGDGAATATAAGAAVGRSVFAGVATASVTVSGQVAGAWFEQRAATGAADSLASAEGAPVLVAVGNCLIFSYESATHHWPFAKAYSVYEAQATASATGTSTAAGVGAIKGDASFTVAATSSVAAEGVANMTPESVGTAAAGRTHVRAYSEDSRTNKYTVVCASTATAVGSFSIAPYEVPAYFDSDAIAAAYGVSASVVEASGTAVGTSLAYSFRGEDYDESVTGSLRVGTPLNEIRVFIGD